MSEKVVALAGGTGGAKLAFGLAQVVGPNLLTVAVNTGDDDYFHGLRVCPDLDTIMYTLAGLSNRTTGWGLAEETFGALEMFAKYHLETWFRLGDRDLATHIERTRLLNLGMTLSEVTEHLCRLLQINQHIVPMSDQEIRTLIHTSDDVLAFQDYFVKQQCKPVLKDISFAGAPNPRIAPGFSEALDNADAVVVCPSNPVVSIGPILAIPDVVDSLSQIRCPIIAVSPIIGGSAVHGPAAKMLTELGEEPTCVGVAKRMVGLCDYFVVDFADEAEMDRIEELGIRAIAYSTMMISDADKINLANDVMKLVHEGHRNERSLDDIDSSAGETNLP